MEYVVSIRAYTRKDGTAGRSAVITFTSDGSVAGPATLPTLRAWQRAAESGALAEAIGRLEKGTGKEASAAGKEAAAVVPEDLADIVRRILAESKK